MNTKESLLDTIDRIEKNTDGDKLLDSLNIVANLMRELENRRSKATYTRKFSLGKLSLTVEFDGMK